MTLPPRHSATTKSSLSARHRTSREPRRETRTTTDPGPLTAVAVGLGANLGDPPSAFAFALARIASFTTGLRVSALYRTAPVDGPPQPDFFNAAAVASTRLPPDAFLERLLAIEREAGRRRGNGRNSPRVLDLDLLLYGRFPIHRRGLSVPHPRMTLRRFVLVPLADLVPGRVVPGTGRTVARLLREAPPARVEPAGVLATPPGARP